MINIPKLQVRVQKTKDRKTGKEYMTESYMMIPPKYLIDAMGWKKGDELLFSRLDDKSVKIERA